MRCLPKGAAAREVAEEAIAEAKAKVEREKEIESKILDTAARDLVDIEKKMTMSLVTAAGTFLIQEAPEDLKKRIPQTITELKKAIAHAKGFWEIQAALISIIHPVVYGHFNEIVTTVTNAFAKTYIEEEKKEKREVKRIDFGDMYQIVLSLEEDSKRKILVHVGDPNSGKVVSWIMNKREVSTLSKKFIEILDEMTYEQ